MTAPSNAGNRFQDPIHDYNVNVDRNGPSIGDLIVFLISHWKALAVGVVLGASAGIVLAFSLPPTYKAETIVSPSSPEQATAALSRIAAQLGPLAGVIGGVGLTGGSNKEVWLAILRSHDLMRAFIEKYQLLPILCADSWPAAAIGRNRFPERSEQLPTMQDAIMVLEKSVISILEDRRTGLITVAIRWRDRQLVAEWANNYVALANQIIRSKAINESKRNIAYLENALRGTAVVERQQIIYRLIESKTNEVMLADGRIDYAFTVVQNAVAPDPDKKVGPRKKLIGSIGAAVGFVLALLFLLARLTKNALF